MRPLLRLLPRLARDRAVRLVLVGGLVLLALAPVLRAGRSGLADGLLAGTDGGSAAVARLLALLLALAAPWVGEGVVSGPRRDGGAALAGVRPVSRVGFQLAGWTAAGLAFLALAVGVAAVVNAAWPGAGSAPGRGSSLSLVGAAASAFVLWVWVGSALLLLSALLDRGEAPLVTAVVLLPALLGASLPQADRLARAAGAWPTRPALRAAREALEGSVPAASDLLAVVLGGALLLGLGLATAVGRHAGR
ncbi:MAG: hypothetical protein R6X22_03410 [Gemmatimonadota bacterium]